MALTEYTLPNVNTPAGEFTLKLYSAIAGLTVPTKQTVKRIGQVSDDVDTSPSVQEAATLDLELTDDRNTYNEGFWFKVFKDEALLKLMLLEDETETYYFFGVVEPLTVEWDDIYTSGTIYVRHANITLTSLVKKIFESETEALMDEIYLNRKPSSNIPVPEYDVKSYFRIKDIMACLLKSSGLNSTFDHNDVSFVCDRSNPDFIFKNGNGQPFLFDELFMATSIQNVAFAGEEASMPCVAMHQQFHYIKDYVSSFLNSFQLIMRFNFDSGRVKIELCQRGRSHADSENAVMPTILRRKFKGASDRRISGIKTYDLFNTTLTRWLSFQYSTDIQSIEVPGYVAIDVDHAVMFRAGVSDAELIAVSPADPLRGMMLFGRSGVSEYESTPEYPVISWDDDRIRTIDYWNYTTGAYDTTANASIDLCEAVCGYVYNRFGAPFQVIEAVYGKIKVGNGSTTSQANAKSLMRTVINDGTGNKTYYATGITKDPEENTLTVIWFEE